MSKKTAYAPCEATWEVRLEERPASTAEESTSVGS
jgi:hypothetical protein